MISVKDGMVGFPYQQSIKFPFVHIKASAYCFFILIVFHFLNDWDSDWVRSLMTSLPHGLLRRTGAGTLWGTYVGSPGHQSPYQVQLRHGLRPAVRSHFLITLEILFASDRVKRNLTKTNKIKKEHDISPILLLQMDICKTHRRLRECLFACLFAWAVLHIGIACWRLVSILIYDRLLLMIKAQGRSGELRPAHR